MSQFVLGILYSKKLHPIIELKRLKQMCEALITVSGTLKMICGDHLDQEALAEVNVLINTLGVYYPQNGWGYLLAYFNRGGKIIHLGPKPFTVPYFSGGHTLKVFEETERALHSLGIIDGFVPTGNIEKTDTIIVEKGQYAYLNDLYHKGIFPKMSVTYSGYYQLADQSISGDHWLDDQVVRSSFLEVGFAVHNAVGDRKAAPLTKVVHMCKGTMVFMNFSTEEGYYESDQGEIFLREIVLHEIKDDCFLEVMPLVGRFTEGEIPVLQYWAKRLRTVGDFINPMEIHLKLSLVDQPDEVIRHILIAQENVNSSFEGQMEIRGLDQGFYKVVGEVIVDGMIHQEMVTGFYLLSDEGITKLLEGFTPLVIDQNVTSDYLVEGDLPFLIHGVNYHTTDYYRKCFIQFNPYQCHLDLSTLTKAGMNMLRTGNWLAYNEFYQDDGSIREGIIRNLEAFFLTALAHGLTAQFVFGAFIMNHWNRSACPIHNLEVRNKTIKAFASFGNHFSKWPNIQVDGLNEPSYSLNGLWQLAKPSLDPAEKVNWTPWLKKRYHNQIEALRENWGIDDTDVKAFHQVELPAKDEQYHRGYDRRDSKPSGGLRDFYDFAFESYSEWVRDLKKASQGFIFMMGRDESLRVPAQQYEAYKKTIDMVNTHQWHKDAFIFSEYLLNRVKGLPCCSQEIGVYQFGDQRQNMRFTEDECAEVLERKLLYAMGNWIQWQAYNDPYMLEIVERSLGLLRCDKTETPSMRVARKLANIEEAMRGYHRHRDESSTEVTLIFPTSGYFSVDSGLVSQGIMKSLQVLFETMKFQSHVVLENLVVADNVDQIGNPKLIIVPALLCLSEATWQELLRLANTGTTLLFSGVIDRDEYWKKTNRLAQIGVGSQLKHVDSVERLIIDDKSFEVSFRETMDYYLPKTVLDKNDFQGAKKNEPYIIPWGKGELIISPLPVEFSHSKEGIEALYAFAMKRAGVKNLLFEMVEPCSDSVVIYPMVYENVTVYTIVNEGFDQSIHFLDKGSNANVQLDLPGQRGSKFWLDKKGSYLGGYLTGKLTINGLSYY